MDEFKINHHSHLYSHLVCKYTDDLTTPAAYEAAVEAATRILEDTMKSFRRGHVSRAVATEAATDYAAVMEMTPAF